MTTLTDYISTKRTAGKRRLPMASEMAERWAGRILARGLHEQGVAGAEQYLADYGRGIAAPKCVALALKAEAEGAPDMAMGFWRKAFLLTTGQVADLPVAAAPPQPAIAPQPLVVPNRLTECPEHLLPGRIITMQPVDAPKPAAFYVASPRYGCQPKRDGNRLVTHVFENVVGQKRSTNVVPLDKVLAEPLEKLAAELGPFILDGELTYLDVAGGEHRSGPQAAQANINLGQPKAPYTLRYCIFKALYASGKDLTARNVCERERLTVGQWIGHFLDDNPHFETLPLALTDAEKAKMLEQQERDGREGVVFMDLACAWVPGKTVGPSAPFVRVKFIKTIDVVVTGLTLSDKPSRIFAAIEIATHKNGKLVSLGAVGTGYTLAQMDELLAAHKANPGKVVIEVGTQGFTENGLVWLGRFLAIRPDKAPEDCVLEI